LGHRYPAGRPRQCRYVLGILPSLETFPQSNAYVSLGISPPSTDR
jgi:hypothetical protein